MRSGFLQDRAQISTHFVMNSKGESKMLEVILDRTSEYVVNADLYPKEVCNVMVDVKNNDQYVLLKQFFANVLDNEKPEYIDGYAIIDPETKTVNRIQLIATFWDGGKRDLVLDVTDPADRIRYYRSFEDYGGDDFKEFIEDSLRVLRAQQAEKMIDLINSHNGIMLDKCGIWPDMISKDELATIIKTPTCKMKERLNALVAYAKKYAIEDNLDELDFYTELAEEFGERDLWLADDQEFVSRAISFMDEHGLLAAS